MKISFTWGINLLILPDCQMQNLEVFQVSHKEHIFSKDLFLFLNMCMDGCVHWVQVPSVIGGYEPPEKGVDHANLGPLQEQ